MFDGIKRIDNQQQGRQADNAQVSSVAGDTQGGASSDPRLEKENEIIINKVIESAIGKRIIESSEVPQIKEELRTVLEKSKGLSVGDRARLLLSAISEHNAAKQSVSAEPETSQSVSTSNNLHAPNEPVPVQDAVVSEPVLPEETENTANVEVSQFSENADSANYSAEKDISEADDDSSINGDPLVEAANKPGSYIERLRGDQNTYTETEQSDEANGIALGDSNIVTGNGAAGQRMIHNEIIMPTEPEPKLGHAKQDIQSEQISQQEPSGLEFGVSDAGGEQGQSLAQAQAFDAHYAARLNEQEYIGASESATLGPGLQEAGGVEDRQTVRLNAYEENEERAIQEEQKRNAGEQIDFFKKYIDEQMQVVSEIIRKNPDLPEAMLSGVVDDMQKSALAISNNNSMSISEKIHLLDDLFEEQKLEYGTGGSMGKEVEVKDVVEDIMTRARADVKTGDDESDERFYTTLQNALDFKVNHLNAEQLKSGALPNILEEEYIKHKKFYLEHIK